MNERISYNFYNLISDIEPCQYVKDRKSDGDCIFCANRRDCAYMEDIANKWQSLQKDQEVTNNHNKL